MTQLFVLNGYYIWARDEATAITLVNNIIKATCV